MFRRLFQRIEQFSKGNEVIETCMVTRHLTVHRLHNPDSIKLSVNWDELSATLLTPAEARRLADVLADMNQKMTDGATT
jgi:hypothetical protein